MYPNTKKKVRAVQWFLVGIMMAFTIGLIFLKPPYAHASEFPSDATTIHTEFTANGTGVSLLASSTRTILYVQFAQDPSRNGQLWIYCGSATEGNEIFETHGADTLQIPMSYLCNKALLYSLTGYGGLGAHVIFTYIDRDISKTFDPLEPITQNGFTYGEILTIFLLLMLFTMLFFNILQRWIFGVRIENPTSFRYDKSQ